ncbi:MAG: 50S ribosomal protein L4 [Bacteriovoracales bacterium]|nr:50S ribosomal protein L4 [Bacteriovoracales bacterium]
MNIDVLNSSFERSSSLKTDMDLSAEKINEGVVHQIVKAALAGRRQGTHSTKTRAQVRGGGAKPFKQKGTGNARQGSIRSAIQVGGGVAFGPKPRSYRQKINKKMASKAVHSILADKYQAGKLVVLEKWESTGKTKELYETLNSRDLFPSLLVTVKKDDLVLRAARNLPRAKGLPVEGFSVYEAVKYENLIIEKEALEKLLERLG